MVLVRERRKVRGTIGGRTGAQGHVHFRLSSEGEELSFLTSGPSFPESSLEEGRRQEAGAITGLEHRIRRLTKDGSMI